jgi:hypothetical protein
VGVGVWETPISTEPLEVVAQVLWL